MTGRRELGVFEPNSNQHLLPVLYDQSIATRLLNGTSFIILSSLCLHEDGKGVDKAQGFHTYNQPLKWLWRMTWSGPLCWLLNALSYSLGDHVQSWKWQTETFLCGTVCICPLDACGVCVCVCVCLFTMGIWKLWRYVKEWTRPILVFYVWWTAMVFIKITVTSGVFISHYYHSLP